MFIGKEKREFNIFNVCPDYSVLLSNLVLLLSLKYAERIILTLVGYPRSDGLF
jgi:hypothetical protein